MTDLLLERADQLQRKGTEIYHHFQEAVRSIEAAASCNGGVQTTPSAVTVEYLEGVQRSKAPAKAAFDWLRQVRIELPSFDSVRAREQRLQKMEFLVEQLEIHVEMLTPSVEADDHQF